MRTRAMLVGLLLGMPLGGCPREPASDDAGIEQPVAVDGGDLDSGDDPALDACARFAGLACDAGVQDASADAGACIPVRLDVVLSSDSVMLFPRPLEAAPCDCSENFVTEPGVCAEAWSDERECWCGTGDEVIYPRDLLDEATLRWSDGGTMMFAPEERERWPWLFGGSLQAYVDSDTLAGDAEVLLRGCFGEAGLTIPSFSPPRVVSLVEQTNDGGMSNWVAVLSDDSTLGHRCRGSEDPSCCGEPPDAVVFDQEFPADYNRVRAVRADSVLPASFGEVRVWTRSDETYLP